MDDGSFVLQSGPGLLLDFIIAAVFVANMKEDFY